MAILKYDEYASNKRTKLLLSPEFEKEAEQLNIQVERVNGQIIFRGPSASLEEIKKVVEEFDKSEKQPGRSELHLASKVEEMTQDLHSFVSLDSMLDAQYKVTQKEINERNKIKSLNIADTRKEIQEMQKEYEDLDEEILELNKSIQKKRKRLEDINKFIEEKTNLILNKIITDPDEIRSVQDLIDIKSKQASDIVEDLDRESQRAEMKMARHKELYCAIHDRYHAIEECERAIREDEETKKKQQEHIDSLPAKTARKLFE